MNIQNTKFVLMDRDGVINLDSDDFIKSPDEWLPIPGSLEAIAELSRNAYGVVVITNQSGISRGLLDLETLGAIHDKMHRAVVELGGRIEAVYFCPHGPDDGCDCRKPKPGLLRRFAKDYRVDLTKLAYIGDSYRDLEAGSQAGAQPILVKTGKGMRTLSTHPELNLPIFENLYDAVQSLLSSR